MDSKVIVQAQPGKNISKTNKQTKTPKTQKGNQFHQGYKVKGPICCHEQKLIRGMWESLWRVLKPLKVEMPDDAGMPPLHMPKGPMSCHRDAYTSMCTAALCTVAKPWKQPNVHPLRDG